MRCRFPPEGQEGNSTLTSAVVGEEVSGSRMSKEIISLTFLEKIVCKLLLNLDFNSAGTRKQWTSPEGLTDFTT